MAMNIAAYFGASTMNTWYINVDRKGLAVHSRCHFMHFYTPKIFFIYTKNPNGITGHQGRNFLK